MSSLPDAINGTFELLGGVFIYLSIIKVCRDKRVAGVSWLHVGFFAAWGVWNLFYYPYLDQWLSFIGGIGIVATNTVYLALLIYYSRRPWYAQ
jgi:hypothetical protein